MTQEDRVARAMAEAPAVKIYCGCGSQKPYEDCCALLHQGADAPSAKALLRARYSAFRLGKADYLLASLHPSKRRPQEAQNIAANLKQIQLESLTILDRVGGKVRHRLATLEYQLRYLRNGQDFLLHELGHFIRAEPHWYYVNSTTLNHRPLGLQSPSLQPPSLESPSHQSPSHQTSSTTPSTQSSPPATAPSGHQGA